MPDQFWGLVAVAAFWGWIFSTIFFILRTFGGPREFRKVPALRWGCALLVSFALWVVAMLNA